MKKTRLMALALGAAITVAGVGYAAWTDKLTVTSTVATGELNVQFVGPQNPNGDNYYRSPRMYYAHRDAQVGTWNWASATPNDLLTSNITYGAKEMTFEFRNMYPGTRGCGLYTFENNGTIPAVIKDVVVTSTTTRDLNPADGEKVLANLKVTHSTLQVIRDGVAIKEGGIDNTPLADLQTKLNNFFDGVRLQPNDKIVLGAADIAGKTVGEEANTTFNFELPIDSLNANEGENETVQIKIEFNFIQHNDAGTQPAGA